jgi:heme-degrading monooxygenase HmoA
VEGKDKILVTNWDTLCKHANWRKTQRNIGMNVKKGEWYHTKYCKHAKNHKLFVSCSYGSVATQLANGMARKN